MSSYLEENAYVKQIDDLTFFQGDTVTIPFEFYDGENNPIDLSLVDIYWYLCPFGQYRTPVLILSSKDLDSSGVPKITIDETQPNLCFVNLSQDDTGNLDYIKYTHQPILIFKNSRGTRRYIRAEGNIIFKPQIRENTTIESLLRRF